MNMTRLVIAVLLLWPVAAQAITPASEEYARIPKGILLDPAQRDAKENAENKNKGDTFVDPQVPTHSLETLGESTSSDDEEKKASIISLVQAQNAYNEGKFMDIIQPLEEMAARNEAGAQLLLGIMYENGQGVKQDYGRAADLISKAAENNLAIAQHRLAVMYHRGVGVPHDDARAMMWLHIAIAHYPSGYEKTRALSDRTNLDALISRRDRETALFTAREWLSRRGEAHLLDAQ